MNKNVVKKVNEIDVWGNLENIRRLFAPDLTKDEFTFFIGMGKSMNANPFKKEIWAVKYDKNKPAQIFLARDLYRRTAQAQKSYAGHYPLSVYENDEFEFNSIIGMPKHVFDVTADRGKLVGAYTLAWRKGIQRPFYVYVKFSEVTKNQSTWNSQPVTQVEKVSEARTLRMAWQDVFAGTYSEAEQGIIEAQIVEDTKYQKEPPEIKKKKETKKGNEKEEPDPKKENKDYKKLLWETLNGMFEGNQNMMDKKLVQLSTYEFTNKKTGEVVQVKGKWDIEKLTEGEAKVVWHKLEKELKGKNNERDLETD